MLAEQITFQIPSHVKTHMQDAFNAMQSHGMYLVDIPIGSLAQNELSRICTIAMVRMKLNGRIAQLEEQEKAPPPPPVLDEDDLRGLYNTRDATQLELTDTEDEGEIL